MSSKSLWGHTIELWRSQRVIVNVSNCHYTDSHVIVKSMWKKIRFTMKSYRGIVWAIESLWGPRNNFKCIQCHCKGYKKSLWGHINFLGRLQRFIENGIQSHYERRQSHCEGTEVNVRCLESHYEGTLTHCEYTHVFKRNTSSQYERQTKLFWGYTNSFWGSNWVTARTQN